MLNKDKNNIGIDLKVLKAYIKENWGKKCKCFDWGCCLCQTWKLYDEIEKFVKTNKLYEKIERKHNLKNESKGR